MSSNHTVARLKAWAREAGFDQVGVAQLGPSDHGPALRRWLQRGDHAAMQWIERRLELRDDPRRLLPGARSVLVVTLQYHPLEGQEEAQGDLWPRVARYARGDDYHDVMGKALKALAARIREAFPGCDTRPYVDTGPVLERELAARAGIGAFGKSTNLLNREAGSYFLLGEILLTLGLPADDPVADLCGSCRLCLDACPTGALPEPYRLDSRRCISYWTIEHRGDLPTEKREMLGDWVFGCDVCQEVCPWNRPTRYRQPRAGREQRLSLPDHRRALDLSSLLGLEREEYVERFRRSPMKRAKLEGLKRNAAVAMGNRGAERYLDALGEALHADESPVVRRHAAWAVGRIGGSRAHSILAEALSDESDREVRAEIRQALAQGP